MTRYRNISSLIVFLVLIAALGIILLSILGVLKDVNPLISIGMIAALAGAWLIGPNP